MLKMELTQGRHGWVPVQQDCNLKLKPILLASRGYVGGRCSVLSSSVYPFVPFAGDCCTYSKLLQGVMQSDLP